MLSAAIGQVEFSAALSRERRFALGAGAVREGGEAGQDAQSRS